MKKKPDLVIVYDENPSDEDETRALLALERLINGKLKKEREK